MITKKSTFLLIILCGCFSLKADELASQLQPQKKDVSAKKTEDKGMFANLGNYCISAAGGASAFVAVHPYTTAIGGVFVVAAVVWTIYNYKAQRATRRLEEQLNEFDF